MKKDHRDLRRSRLGGAGRQVLEGDDHAHSVADEIVGRRIGSFLDLQVSPVQVDSTPLLVAQRRELVAQGLQRWWYMVSAHVEETKAMDSPRRLRLPRPPPTPCQQPQAHSPSALHDLAAAPAVRHAGGSQRDIGLSVASGRPAPLDGVPG
jgi:hypothetical protein